MRWEEQPSRWQVLRIIAMPSCGAFINHLSYCWDAWCTRGQVTGEDVRHIRLRPAFFSHRRNTWRQFILFWFEIYHEAENGTVVYILTDIMQRWRPDEWHIFPGDNPSWNDWIEYAVVIHPLQESEHVTNALRANNNAARLSSSSVIISSIDASFCCQQSFHRRFPHSPSP